MKTREEQLQRILQEAVAKAGKASKIMNAQRDAAWFENRRIVEPEMRVLVVYQPDMTDYKLDLSKIKVTCGTRKQLFTRNVFVINNILIAITICDDYDSKDIYEAVSEAIEYNSPEFKGMPDWQQDDYINWINNIRI